MATLESFREKMDTLKTMILNESEIKAPYHYFFDHFGENPAFLELSTPKEHDFLPKILRLTAREILGREVVSPEQVSMYVPDFLFYHGPLNFNGVMGSFLFCEELGVGLMGLTNDDTGETQFARFTSYKVAGIREPMFFHIPKERTIN